MRSRVPRAVRIYRATRDEVPITIEMYNTLLSASSPSLAAVTELRTDMAAATILPNEATYQVERATAAPTRPAATGASGAARHGETEAGGLGEPDLGHALGLGLGRRAVVVARVLMLVAEGARALLADEGVGGVELLAAPGEAALLHASALDALGGRAALGALTAHELVRGSTRWPGC